MREQPGLYPSGYVIEKLNLGEFLQASFQWSYAPEEHSYWYGKRNEWKSITDLEIIKTVVGAGVVKEARKQITRGRVKADSINMPLQLLHERFKKLALYEERFGRFPPAEVVAAVIGS